MTEEKECRACFGTGMVEHKSCNGLGCDRDGCEDGEIICLKCDGLGYLTKGKSDDEEDIDIDGELEKDGNIEGTGEEDDSI